MVRIRQETEGEEPFMCRTSRYAKSERGAIILAEDCSSRSISKHCCSNCWRSESRSRRCHKSSRRPRQNNPLRLSDRGSTHGASHANSQPLPPPERPGPSESYSVYTWATNPKPSVAYKETKFEPRIKLNEVYDEVGSKEDLVRVSVRVVQRSGGADVAGDEYEPLRVGDD